MTTEAKLITNVVDSVVARYDHDKSLLVSILRDIQAEYGYLPQEALARVGGCLGVPVSQVYGVATFFKAFSLKPRGRHVINVCLGTACHVRGGIKILEKLERNLQINRGETTPDARFTLETVNCIGACALGPMMTIDGKYHGQLTAEKVDAVLKKYA